MCKRIEVYMKLSIIMTLLSLFLLSHCQKKARPLFLPEWSPKHQSIWLASPSFGIIKGQPTWTIQLEIMKILSSKKIRTDYVVQDEKEIFFELVRFYHVPHGDIWMRDMGPIFLKDGGTLKMADFRFNDWGYSIVSKDEKVDAEVARLLGLSTVQSSIFSEGGGWDINTQGVMLTTRAVQFQRNPQMTEKEIEEEAKESPILQKSRAVLETAYEILKKETNRDGKPFKIVRIPMPEPIFITMQKGDGTFDFLYSLTFEDGTKILPNEKIKIILAASYINYLVTNNLVIMAKYHKEGRTAKVLERDKIAKQILQEAYPNREVIQIDVDILNAGGGGIHCITQQMPE